MKLFSINYIKISFYHNLSILSNYIKKKTKEKYAIKCSDIKNYFPNDHLDYSLRTKYNLKRENQQKKILKELSNYVV